MYLSLLRSGWVLAALSLTACAEIVPFGFGVNDTPTTADTTRLALLDRSVVAQGPSGYCVSSEASRPSDGFAVLALCDPAGGSADLTNAAELVTVQIGDVGSALGVDAAELAALLASDAGRSLLSANGQADNVSIQSADVRSGGVTVQFVDSAPPPISGLQQEEWRGFLNLDGRLATIAVRGLSALPLDTQEGQILLERMMLAMLQANGTTDI